LVDTDPGAGGEPVAPANAPTQLLPTVGEAPSVRAVARRVASALPALGRDGGQPEVPRSARATVDRRRRAAAEATGEVAPPAPPKPAPPADPGPPPAPNAVTPPAAVRPRHAAPDAVPGVNPAPALDPAPAPTPEPAKTSFVELTITTAAEAAPAPRVVEPTPPRPTTPAARLVEPVMVSLGPLMGQPPVEAGRRAVVDADVLPDQVVVGAAAAEMVTALTEVAFREATADEWIVAEPALRDALPPVPEPVPSGPRVLVADSWDTAPQPFVQQDSYLGRRRAVPVNTRLWLVIGLVVAALSAAVAVPFLLTTDATPTAQTTPEAAALVASDEDPAATDISGTSSAEPSPSTSAPMPAVGASPLVTESPPEVVLTVEAEKGGTSTAWGGTAVKSTFAGATVIDKLGEKWQTSTIDGWLEFRNINPGGGSYTLKIFYVYTSAGPNDSTRRISISVNGGSVSPVQTFTPVSTVTERAVKVTLRAGSNTIRLTSDDFECPAIDRIEITKP
jgi:hypothetical protein